MSLFSSILHSIEKNITKQKSNQAQIAQCIQETIGIQIPETMMTHSRGVLTVRTSPTVKAALLLKQAVILEEFKKRGIKIFTIR